MGAHRDTFAVVDQLQRFGYERWFNLGDRDLAMAIHRTRLLRQVCRCTRWLPDWRGTGG